MLNDIILICFICLAYGYWVNAQKTKKIALGSANNHCLSLNVRMLDDHVALNGICLKRDKAGKMKLQRSFLFEFSSTDNERYNGTVLMLGGMWNRFIWNLTELIRAASPMTEIIFIKDTLV